MTSGRGVDIILDIVGGDYLARNFEALTVDGRLVQIGLQGGASTTINLATLMQRRLTVTGSTLRSRSVAEKAAIAREVEQHVWPLLSSGIVAPVIDRTLPLEEAAEAHRLLESGDIIGKIVLTVGGRGLSGRRVSREKAEGKSEPQPRRPEAGYLGSDNTPSHTSALMHASAAKMPRVPGATSCGSVDQNSDWIEVAARARMPATASAGAAGVPMRSIRPATAQTIATTPCTASSIHAGAPRIPIVGSAEISSTAKVPGAQISR